MNTDYYSIELSKLLQPKKRSQLRLFAGKTYYTCIRHLKWLKNGRKYTIRHISDELPYIVKSHSTPLYRSLKNVDMWMQENKIHNLKIALKKVNNIIIEPGQTFSYWKLIGKPNKFKGYKKGMILYYGKFKPGTGGGLCQLSNLIFWSALHTPLTITERYRHSYDVFPDVNRKQPFGSGATCVYNYRDLQITNETDSAFQLKLWIEDGNLNGKWLSNHSPLHDYEIYEQDHQIIHHDWGGYSRHNILARRTINNGEIIEDKALFENHALMMYQPFLTT